MNNNKRLERISKLLANLTAINTTIINNNLVITTEFYINKLPQLIEDYFKDMHIYAYQNTIKDSSHKVTHIYTPQYLNFLSIPVLNEENITDCLIIGPFLTDEPRSMLIKDVMIQNQIPITLQSSLKEYYRSLTVLDDYELKNISECLYEFVQSSRYSPDTEYELVTAQTSSPPKDLLYPNQIKENKEMYIELLEKRYMNEKEILFAVQHGDTKSAIQHMKEGAFFFSYQDRVPNNPIRSHKNITFVFNTLLRKAAEAGGVHPIYTDDLSSRYAVLIEKITNSDDVLKLHTDMIKEYCELVLNLSTKDYSHFIKNIIEYIRINLDSDLSLETISKIVSASPSKISRNFKAETGESITDYINKARIDAATSLISDDRLSLTDIAFKVGFNDTNYFSKIFKRLTGKSPSDYRKDIYSQKDGGIG